MGVRDSRVSATKAYFKRCLDRLGEMPLPPYIKERLDRRERYQTVYAKHEGQQLHQQQGFISPKHFLEQIEAKGVHLAYVTCMWD